MITQTCNLPSKLRGMVTQAVGVAPLDVMAFSSSCSPPILAEDERERERVIGTPWNFIPMDD